MLQLNQKLQTSQNGAPRGSGSVMSPTAAVQLKPSGFWSEMNPCEEDEACGCSPSLSLTFTWQPYTLEMSPDWTWCDAVRVHEGQTHHDWADDFLPWLGSDIGASREKGRSPSSVEKYTGRQKIHINTTKLHYRKLLFSNVVVIRSLSLSRLYIVFPLFAVDSLWP